MYDFLVQNSLYVVLLIALVCWIGIFSYLVRLDKKITELEKRISK